MSADGSFVPKKRLSCRCPAARPVRPAHPARNFPETKKIICPAHAAHVGHMIGGLVQFSPENSFHRCGGPPPSKREVFGEGKRKLAEYRRARIARPYNVAENCNCEMCLQRRVASLQPSVAPPSPVGARIARPFISDVITTLREGARRVIGATAKPLYPIDGKAIGLDRRSPRPPSSREGDRPQAVEGVDALR